MGIGTGIALVVIGAILAFAVNVDVPAVDLTLIGYILMAAGAVVFLISLILVLRHRQVSSTTRSAVDPNSGERVTRRSTTDNDGPVL
ncbi:DUF6458 family protein [Plantibacter sp. LMC-P-059a]|jgi:Na+-transporting methylmalonyl-CoA/oxaloacetate decarboxylase gamma subunit|uniref:DUF6458 family protein n=1 Tax=Plantibacter sp. LMC-P-059a TaxID=3040297 RepID=UPI00254CD982|nr:DUF6458 family protein [Plantibacter sp. LMC-P-059a]